MIHSFVVARLLSRLPSWTPYGQRAVAALTTKPFLALHLKQEDPDFIRAPNLFIISREKPSWPGSEYFILNRQSVAHLRSLTVVPPLPFEGPLYLSTTPNICATFPDAEEHQELLGDTTYQLDGISSSQLLAALEKAGPSIHVARNTGAADEPGPEWDTWSGYTPRESPGLVVLGHEVMLAFEVLPLENLSPSFETSILHEIPLMRQLSLDYSWKGITNVTSYIQSMREQMDSIAASGRIFRDPSFSASRDRRFDPSSDVFRASTAALKALPVIHDGDPRGEADIEEVELADDLKDEELPMLELPMAPLTPAIEPTCIKIIIFDPNVFINRDDPLKAALTSVFPPWKHRYSPVELLKFYVEFESIRSSDRLQSVSQTAVFKDVARYLDVQVEDSSIENAIERHLQGPVFTESVNVLKSLACAGYISMALPSTVDQTTVASIVGISPALFSVDVAAQNQTLSWDLVFAFFKAHHPTVHQSQILVVSSELYRICEPASHAGFPTAFFKGKGTRSATLSIPTIVPTYTLTNLDELLPLLDNPNSVLPPKEPVLDMANPPFRIRDTYQCTHLLGAGTFSYVWNAIQVQTTASIAIKFELIDPAVPSTIPYEAAIYAQLKGVQGVPRVRWTGQDMNANVLVMDKVGPNLESLRRFCRGRFGLKTVLMLGEQMLRTIEQVHERGIIIRDIKPDNFAPGFVEDHRCLFLFDMGLAKLYADPLTGDHMPFREGRGGIGTPRYASHDVHFGLEPSRRDDIEAIGMLLLFLLHGRLPWQGICAPDIPSKLRRIGEMKRGEPFRTLLARSPTFFTSFFEHCRSLQFTDKPEYDRLRELLRGEMEANGWEYDWQYDWWQPGERGTLLPEEYKIDERWVEPARRVVGSF
ncbi:hypothetical protein HGRIS_012077 [Hohenbuehelia grisea]|uniref:Protein kinase domain-containing protein n=1 Tax=Hohenbuehelia grisea TaxID=104357 RepID=A0ABR3IR83_9AGAR